MFVVTSRAVHAVQAGEIYISLPVCESQKFCNFVQQIIIYMIVAFVGPPIGRGENV